MKKTYFIIGSIFILLSGILYTIQWFFNNYISISKGYFFEYDYKVVVPFAIIGIVLWVISSFEKET